MKDQSDAKLMVLVQRHLTLESQLAASLEQLNDATSKALNDGGVRGPNAQDVQELEPRNNDVQTNASEIATARHALLLRAGEQTGKEYFSIKQIISDLPKQSAAHLEELRHEILHRCQAAQTGLINNQAMLHYTFDFHRKYLAGVFGQETENQNYRSNGQSQEAVRGNLFGRTC